MMSSNKLSRLPIRQLKKEMKTIDFDYTMLQLYHKADSKLLMSAEATVNYTLLSCIVLCSVDSGLVVLDAHGLVPASDDYEVEGKLLCSRMRRLLDTVLYLRGHTMRLRCPSTRT